MQTDRIGRVFKRIRTKKGGHSRPPVPVWKPRVRFGRRHPPGCPLPKQQCRGSAVAFDFFFQFVKLGFKPPFQLLDRRLTLLIRLV
ncbi:hypothetical protein M702_10820 [Neisseria gonorrhoeae SK28355]|nr:hypothetical protein M702_10820 [Neisseria gonorrhoeae SK28355]KLS02445.1 hypothetical protein M686_12595 [Neisseria gonorrhoeae SK16942]KLS16392.1 hypothetical protein M687_09600 [Neisseria gonorrhoeae SK17973]KLS62961.1 hypothetical protein M739_03535 [Neisseria gonorrhoeae MIA_2011_05-16]